MLFRLLELIEEHGERVDLIGFSRVLDSHPQAVAGMIDMLVAMGRLKRPEAECGLCDGCDARGNCPLTSTPGPCNEPWRKAVTSS